MGVAKKVFLLLLVFCCTKLCAYDFQAGGLYYEIINGTNEVFIHPANSKIQMRYSGDITIPETVTDYSGNVYTVVGIGEYAFAVSSITSIIMPNTIRFIDEYAFTQCSQLKNIILPSSLEKIGRNILSSSSISTLKIPSSVTDIANYAFSSSSLESIDLSELSSSVKELPEGLFSNSRKLKSIVVPNTVTIIGKDLFMGCDNLSSVSLPNSITKIEEQAFYGCVSLENINIPNQIKDIGRYAFQSCGIKEIKIPASIRIIKEATFFNCQKLESITLPSSLYAIDKSAFASCIKLVDITLPNSLTIIGQEAFGNCENLTKIILPSAITSIGKNAFHINTKEVHSKILSPFETYAFSSWSGGHHDRILYVPVGTKELYSNCYGWGNFFKEIIEEIQTFSLQITSTGNGSVLYEDSEVRNKMSSFTVNESSSATLSLIADNGYRIKSVKVNSANVTSSVSNNRYTVSNIQRNTTVEVEFEAIPPTTYTLSISSTGSGYASYDGTTIRSRTSAFTVTEGTNAIISFSADNGYRIKSVKVNSSDVTSSVSNNRYTVSNIQRNTTVDVEFEAIPPTTYTLSITSAGSGYASYDGTTIRSRTSTFTVSEGTNATITFSADNGYRIKSVKVNSSDVTSSVSNNRYTVSNIQRNTSVEVEFEAISPTTYTLSISSTGSGYASYDGTTIRSRTSTFTVNEGTNATISFSADNGYRIKSVKVNSTDVTSSVSNNRYTVSNIQRNTSVEVEFEAIPPTTYTLSVSSTGSGYASYAGTTIRSRTSTFTVNEGTNATITFSADNGYRIKSVKVNSSDVTSSVSNNRYTVSNIQRNTTVDVEFEAIPPTTYTLSITSTGSGYASYAGTTIRSRTSTFTVNEGTDAPISFNVDNGYRIKSVKLNGSDVTSSVSNNWYTVSNIQRNTTLEVEFEAIPPTTYTLSVSSTGNGSASYDGTTIRSKTSTFTVNEGANATISFSADNGYWIKSVKVNSSDVTSSVSNNRYTISNIQRNTTVEVEFEAIPPTTYTLSISSMGNGYAFYDGTTIRSKTSSFTVTEGTNATIIFSADNGNRIKSVKVNSTDVISSVSNNQYTISNIQRNTNVEVEFQEDVKSFATGGLNYAVVSYDNKTVNLANGKYGTILEVPETVTYQGVTWKVAGMDNAALANNEELAAIIWNPSAAFTVSVSNPNLLLYVNSASYAPAAIKNVVVNSIADNIVLTDAASGNTFYCPQEFIAKKISYTHNYGMITGLGESRGWETIALPFDVKKIAHSSKGELTPFANWKSGDSKKPFWLMSYGIGGWTNASSIKANTPYIISMPNNDDYKTEFRVNGNVTFSAENVIVKKSDDLQKGSYNGNTLVPNYANMDSNEILALNVNNDFVSYTGGAAEGSAFVANLRPVYPFEAYMTTASSARRYISINDDMTTGIEEFSVLMDESKGVRIYNLKGQLIMTEHGESIDEVGRLLPAGVYVVNGRKLIIK